MSKLRFRRRRLWVDGRIQGAIVVRLLTYYLACGITATCMLVAWRVAVYGVQGGLAQHLSQLWTQMGPGALSLVLLLPMFVFDAVRLSHRFTGPMFRIRKAMKAAAKGEKVTPIQLRETDYWQDLADDLNSLLESFDAIKPAAADTERDNADQFDATLQDAIEARTAASKATQSSEKSQSTEQQSSEKASSSELESASR